MKKQKHNTLYIPLIVTGYTLFAVLVVTIFVSTTLPWMSIIGHPNVLKINAFVAMSALTLGALLPVIVGYGIGDHAVRSKNTRRHHFNGVLFGLLAYWLMAIAAGFIPIPSQLFPDNNMRLIVVNLIPSLVIGIVATSIAVLHVKSKHAAHDVLSYPPFVGVLIASIVFVPALSIINNVVTNSVSVYTFLLAGVIALSGLVSYVSLRHTKRTTQDKVAWSAVSVSVLMVTVFVASLFESAVVSYLWQPTSEVYAISSLISFGVALVGWTLFWVYQVRALVRAR